MQQRAAISGFNSITGLKIVTNSVTEFSQRFFKTRIAAVALFIFPYFAAYGFETHSAKPEQIRNATLVEIQQLFDLAILKPNRIRLVADITIATAAWTDDQVAAELSNQNAVMAERDKKLNPKVRQDLFNARSNAIVQSHSDIKLFRAQEWYSGKLYRFDYSNSSSKESSSFTTNEHGFTETFVNIDDPAFSEYVSFSVDHHLRSALLSKDPRRRYQTHSLWQVLGIDPPAALPLIIALVDYRFVTNGVSDPHNLTRLRVDPLKAESLRSGYNPVWKLAAIDELHSGKQVTHFRLEGKCPDADAESPTHVSLIKADYWIAHYSGNSVCVNIEITNITRRTFLSSTREEFDSRGLPHVWKTSTIEKNSSRSERRVKYLEIEKSPTFEDSVVFAPAFPGNYSVSDITSGTGVLIQNPYLDLKTGTGSPQPTQKSTVKKTIIFGLLLFIAITPTLIFFFNRKRVGQAE